MDKSDKFSFIKSKNKKKNTTKGSAGNDSVSNAEPTSFDARREMSDRPGEGENVLISPFPENRRYTYGLSL